MGASVEEVECWLGMRAEAALELAKGAEINIDRLAERSEGAMDGEGGEVSETVLGCEWSELCADHQRDGVQLLIDEGEVVNCLSVHDRARRKRKWQRECVAE